MPIFKNPNEAAYLGGKKHFTDVIKNSGHANAIIWRQPEKILIQIQPWSLCLANKLFSSKAA